MGYPGGGHRLLLMAVWTLPVSAASSGPWMRAQANGYTMCGRGATYSTGEHTSEHVYGFASTITYTGSNCSGSYASGASVRVVAALYGTVGLGWVACGPRADSGYRATGAWSVNVFNDYCTGSTHFYATTSSQHGGWIQGTEYPPNHFPLTTPSEYF